MKPEEMTPEEAIEILKPIPDFVEWSRVFEGEKIIEALSLAIKALENKPICIAKVTFDEDKLKELTDKIVEQMRSGEIVLMPDPQPKKGKWIPTCERAPEKNGWFITTCEDICGRAVHTVGYDAKHKKWGRGGVIAWQPMPEPYKEAEK